MTTARDGAAAGAPSVVATAAARRGCRRCAGAGRRCCQAALEQTFEGLKIRQSEQRGGTEAAGAAPHPLFTCRRLHRSCSREGHCAGKLSRKELAGWATGIAGRRAPSVPLALACVAFTSSDTCSRRDPALVALITYHSRGLWRSCQPHGAALVSLVLLAARRAALALHMPCSSLDKAIGRHATRREGGWAGWPLGARQPGYPAPPPPPAFSPSRTCKPIASRSGWRSCRPDCSAAPAPAALPPPPTGRSALPGCCLSALLSSDLPSRSRWSTPTWVAPLSSPRVPRRLRWRWSAARSGAAPC